MYKCKFIFRNTAKRERSLMKKIVLAGLEGKMGTFLLEGLRKEANIQIVAGVGEVQKLDQEIPIYSDLYELIENIEFDVYVDFTEHEFSKYAAEIMALAEKPIVVGTTGFSEEDIEDIKNFGGKGVIAPNFSIGAVLLNTFAEMCAHYFEDFAINEYHHRAKKDNPSGTAIYIANNIDRNLSRSLNTTPVHGIRLPGVLATHHIVISDESQKLELIHQSNNRQSFVKGVILAITKVDDLEEIIYGLEHIIK